MQRIKMEGNRKFYLLVTTCGSFGNTGGYARRLAGAIGMKWMGWYTFYMPGSYVAFMENPDVEHAAQMNRRARAQIRKIVPVLKKGEALKPFPVTWAGKFMSRPPIRSFTVLFLEGMDFIRQNAATAVGNVPESVR